MKCDICRREISISCDWNQGRCPHRPSILNLDSTRFYNLYISIKQWLKK